MDHIIALVDDDTNIRTSVSMALEDDGYKVIAFSDGSSALDGLKKVNVDLIILDIKMPIMNGLEMLKEYRKENNTPVIMLTSKDDEEDELLSFDLGADDFVKKPFSLILLKARIKTILKRTNSTQENKETIKRGGLSLDVNCHECLFNGQKIDMTVTEFLILQSLVSRPGHVKSREQLICAAYGDNIYVDDRTIDSHIKRIRKKIKKIDQSFSNIEALYGIGYRYKEE